MSIMMIETCWVNITRINIYTCDIHLVFSYPIVRYVFSFSLQILLETFLILRRHERDKIKICIGLHVECLLFLSDVKYIWIFSTKFWTILKYQISFKSVQWQPICSLRTDGHDGANSPFFFAILRTRLKPIIEWCRGENICFFRRLPIIIDFV